MYDKRLIRLCQSALLAAVAVGLVYLLHFPLIPAAPFLEYDMADVPVLLAALLFGPGWGLGVLAVVSLVQAFLLGGNGWVGALMHFASSGVLVLTVGLIYRAGLPKGRRTLRLIVGMVVGTLAMAAAMVPLNLTLTVYFLGSPRQVVLDMLVPAILPFNLLKAAINCVLTAVLFGALRPVLRRFSAAWGLSL